MRVLQRHWRFAAVAVITAGFTAVSVVCHRGFALTAFSDVINLLLMLAAAGVMASNARRKPGAERTFWSLMAFSFLLWAFNQAAWVYCEVILRTPMPDPFFADVVLFFHFVPMIAAIVWRPDAIKDEPRFRVSTVNFLMLLVWWVFLYAFVVFPHQYVLVNAAAYDRCYIPLYELEGVLLLTTLAFATLNTHGSWKNLYLNLLAAEALYCVGSQFLDRAVARGTYYSGSLYDLPLVCAIAWIAATALAARKSDFQSVSRVPTWRAERIVPNLAMSAILSLPIFGLWALFIDDSPAVVRNFRLYAVLAAILVLGAFVFLRQYFQDRALVQLLDDSRKGFENQQLLQNQLVQREKLASLGEFVAGAAREIHHPLAAVMEYSERLWSHEPLNAEQDAMVRKIVHQAQRTRDLVTDLLSFAQQTSGEKALVDVSVLLHRAAQMLEAQHHARRVRIEVIVETGFPRVLGNANQLFQAFIEIIENSVDALEELGGGSMKITACRQGNHAVLQFADSGPGIREPQRVFDPFYTTKPVGKGTGLGLSAVYGVVQDHDGQITCHNQPEGGALFILRLPAESAVAPVAEAAKA